MTEAMGIGPHAMWGFSPAQDLLEGYLKQRRHAADDDTPVNILVVNSADVRHLLRTVATRRRHFAPGKARPVHFYIWDRPAEVLARHLALLHLALNPELPIRQRASIWLEVFGNTLVQERTERLIGGLGREMVRLVCDGAGLLSPLVDLTLLKFRERDALEFTFKTWAPSVPFDAALLRDTRLRRLYEQRYDNRKNVADWDYHEGVKPVASIVHYKQFQEWRASGVAFEFGDQTYSRPNRTMATYAEGTMCKGKDRGLKKEVKGYWVDLVVGPFAAMGVDCDKPNKFAEDLFLVHNQGTGCAQHRHHAVEVAVYNIISYIWEIENGSVYQMTREHDIYSGLGEKKEEADKPRGGEEVGGQPKGVGPEKEAERVQELSPQEFEKLLQKQKVDGAAPEPAPSRPPADARSAKADAGSEEKLMATTAALPEEAFEGIKVFIVGDDFRSMYGKKRFQGLFDVVALSVGASHFMADADLSAILSPEGAYVMVENAKYLVPLNKKAKLEYVNKIKEMAKERNWTDDFGKKKRNIEDLKLRDWLPYHAHAAAGGRPDSS